MQGQSNKARDFLVIQLKTNKSYFLGLMLMPTTVLVYLQLGQFLMLVMVFSWLYSTFSFLAICNVIGPKNDFGQLSIARLFAHCGRCLRRVKPKDSEEFQETNELGKVEPKDSSNPINENEPGNVTSDYLKKQDTVTFDHLDEPEIVKPAHIYEPDTVNFDHTDEPKLADPAHIDESKIEQSDEKHTEIRDLGIVNKGADSAEEINTAL